MREHSVAEFSPTLNSFLDITVNSALTKQKQTPKERDVVALLFLLSHTDFQSMDGGLLLEMEYGKKILEKASMIIKLSEEC